MKRAWTMKALMLQRNNIRCQGQQVKPTQSITEQLLTINKLAWTMKALMLRWNLQSL